MNQILAAVFGEGGAVLSRLEAKLDAHGERLSAIQVEIAGLKATEYEAHARTGRFFDEEWPMVQRMVQDTARQLALNVQTVGSLADTVRALEGRVDRGEGQIAELRRLQDKVDTLEKTDEKVIRKVEGLEKKVLTWGGGLAVVVVVATAAWGIISSQLDVVPVQAPPAQIQPPV